MEPVAETDRRAERGAPLPASAVELLEPSDRNSRSGERHERRSVCGGSGRITRQGGRGVGLERGRAVSDPQRGRPGPIPQGRDQVRLSEGAESAVGLSKDERPEQSLWREERAEERLWRERDCARQGWDVDLQPNRVVAEGRGGGAKGRCCLWQLMARATTDRPEASTVGLPGAFASVERGPIVTTSVKKSSHVRMVLRKVIIPFSPAKIPAQMPDSNQYRRMTIDRDR